MTFMLQPEVNGRKIGFETGPKGVLADRPSLVLIHGAGGSRESWRFQTGALDDKVNAVALELPGHGETEGPPLERTSEMADFVAEALKSWNLPKPVAVCGHSMGGAVCLELALRHPDLIQGLILAGTGASLGVNPALFDGLKNDFSGTVKLIVKWTLAKNSSRALVEESQVLLAGAGSELLITDFTACDQYNVTQELGKIKVPALVAGGADDKMTPPTLSEFMAENLQNARLEILAGAGHTLICEQPDEFNRVALDFMMSL